MSLKPNSRYAAVTPLTSVELLQTYTGVAESRLWPSVSIPMTVHSKARWCSGVGTRTLRPADPHFKIDLGVSHDMSELVSAHLFLCGVLPPALTAPRNNKVLALSVVAAEENP